MYYDNRLAQAEKVVILQTLDDTRGNKSEAARLLGIARDTLRVRLKHYQYVSKPYPPLPKEKPPPKRKKIKKQNKAPEQALPNLAVLGVPTTMLYPSDKFVPLWDRPYWEIEEMLALAKKLYREKIKQHHPDKGGSVEKVLPIIHAWHKVKRIAIRHGYKL